MDSPDWLDNAQCKKYNIDFWYPPLDADVPDKYYKIAREVCKTCPVWKPCLETGLTEKWGMWGGLTPLERTALVEVSPKTNAIKEHGTWIRHRQGCLCALCVGKHKDITETIGIYDIPLKNNNVFDINVLTTELFTG